MYVYHRQESKSPLFAFQRKYDNPYDVPIEPEDYTPTLQEIREQAYRDQEVSLGETVEGEYDFTGWERSEFVLLYCEFI